MSKPFDASPKDLVQLRPADWLAFLGVAARSVEVVDSDVSTVTAAADKVLLVRAAEGDRMQHIDFQSGPDTSVPRRSHSYSALLHERHKLPVESVVVVLLGLRYGEGFVQQLLSGVGAVRESTFYQVVQNEGRVAQLREDIQRLGERKFRSQRQSPSGGAIEGTADVARLKQTLERILDVDTWEALLAHPSAPAALPQGGTATKSPTPRRRKKR